MTIDTAASARTLLLLALLAVAAPAAAQTGADEWKTMVVEVSHVGRMDPPAELRARLDELPPPQEVVVYCQVGQRGYLATRILNQKGYRAKNLSGGYETYLLAISC